MPNEVELKLLIDPHDVPRLWRHPFLTASTHRKFPAQRLLSIYYDTPELTLYKHKVAVRLRRAGDRWLQTVKTAGSVAAGLHERPEWEYETAENTLNFDPVDDPKLRDFFADASLLQTLSPVFITDFSRTRRMLEWPEGEVVEFSLDRGEIRAREQTQPISEVELELKAGAPGRLFALALALQDAIPLRLENVSKAERGYQLLIGATVAPQKAKTPVLNVNEAPPAAFVRIAQECIAHLQANEKGVLSEHNPEFIHQMRVASRRLRSAFSVFSDLIAEERLAPIRKELRWFTGELDGARNWDVFVWQTLPPICTAFPDHEGLRWCAEQSAELRQRANERAREAVLSARYQKFLLALGAWLSTEAWRSPNRSTPSETVGLSVIDFAAGVLQKRHKKLKKKGNRLATQTPEERHAIRIAAKKVRYAAEFFSSLFPRKRTQRYIDALAALQDVLGAMNDSATTVTLLRQIATSDDDSQQHQAKGIILGWVVSNSHAQLDVLATRWENLLARKLFWP